MKPNGCKYCKDLCELYDDQGTWGMVQSDGHLFLSDRRSPGGVYLDLSINFCPMCGAQLPLTSHEEDK